MTILATQKLTPLLVSCLKEWQITSLTDVQERATEAEVPLGSSAIVCAPTSSGKTLIGELALANALSNGLDALYLVSHKALAEQKFSDFTDRFSTRAWVPAVTVGISTGDHEEGDVNCRLLISTYEKALGLILSGRLKVTNTAIIADELQILGEAGRGASVETLCALLRQRQPRQFVGLTATVENPEDLAAWMNCQSVRSNKRDVELIQTIHYNGKQYTVLFGQEDGETTVDKFGQSDLHGVIRTLLHQDLGPVLVFTETRREALDLATAYSAQCQRATDGLVISRQLELFSEPTESSQQLRSHAERRVTFHTADLTPDERSVIESGFVNASFDVCFATSTLAAGVNFPFRTVVIAKLTYGYPQTLTNHIGMLARRVRWGTPVEAIDVLRIATRKSVPGFGRQRVMTLIANGLKTVMDVISAKKEQLVKLLGGEQRADALVAALSDSFDGASANFEGMHLQLGREIGVEEKVAKCNQALGVEYDEAIYDLLKEELNWAVDKLDDGKRQNVPDIQLVLGDTALLIECRTVTKKPPLIAKEEAFAVLQKASDFDQKMNRVTLGKPEFDEHSQKKAAASPSITLVRHDVFMEGLMRVLTGRLTPCDFVNWLAEPGVTDLSRLPGTPTYCEPEPPEPST
ncbi:MAG TPA: DEAD/DEAH box helicase [Pirellulales bacterium]|nr:DEAD/DEAH box helicase [Pirellulales bacterium]